MSKKFNLKPKVLYITYDGLLDPLGESQILPYLIGLRPSLKILRIISFEKPNFSKEMIIKKRRELERHNIDWSPLLFSNTQNIFFKIIDLLKMYQKALFLNLKFKYEVVHCRSYLAMKVGIFLKIFFKLITIFDMRGLWVDDRLDGGRWPQKNIFYKFIYIYWKFVEKKLFENADHIVALTPQTKLIINQITKKQMKNVSIIPCCADFMHFDLLNKKEKETLRKKMSISDKSLVISYLGSIGTIYLWDEMLSFFIKLNKEYPNSYFLVITKNWNQKRQNELESKINKEIIERIIFKSANRDEVPFLLGISDVMLSFRKNSFSQKACNPTKIGEALACGIPVISNKDVGDVNRIIQKLEAGAIINLGDDNEIDKVIKRMDNIKNKGGYELRLRSKNLFDLDAGINLYKGVYEKIKLIK